jgi:tRNA(Ile2) C34 agmatinyltransferase TiaS
MVMRKYILSLKAKKGKEVQCPRCSKKWNYHGERVFYIQCPDCKYTFRKDENEVKKICGGENVRRLDDAASLHENPRRKMNR